MKLFYTAPPDPQQVFHREIQLFRRMHTGLIVSVTILGKKEPEAKMEEITGRQDTALQGSGSSGWASPVGITSVNASKLH